MPLKNITVLGSGIMGHGIAQVSAMAGYNVVLRDIEQKFLDKAMEKKTGTKCEKCGLELHQPQRLERHMKKAHGNVPEKKLDESAGDGGLW